MLLGRLTQKFLQVQEDNQIRKSINISVLTHVKKKTKKRDIKGPLCLFLIIKKNHGNGGISPDKMRQIQKVVGGVNQGNVGWL